MSEIDDLRSRLKQVITQTCNKLGCDKCDLKWEGGCSSVDLEDKIYEIELNEMEVKS